MLACICGGIFEFLWLALGLVGLVSSTSFATSLYNKKCRCCSCKKKVQDHAK